MGHNISSINGVKSENFYEQGNGINEIWVDDLEVISRLPFGDSDLGQAGWPAGNWPKIPWHQFIIPLKRDITSVSDINSINNTLTMTETNTCPCLKTYPEVGYFGMYKSWNPSAAGLFGSLITALGIYMLAYISFQLQWNEVILELHRFMPDNAAVGAAVRDREPPIRAGSWHFVKPWLWRRCLYKLLILVSAIVLVVCGIPGGMQAAKDMSGPQVFFVTWKWIAISIGTNIGTQFLIDVGLLYCWGWKARKDANSLRNLEQNLGFNTGIETSGDPRSTALQVMGTEVPKAEEP
ncbi:hypothetical protein N7486_004475 [Penicillium sp. IBT 16267x]|nr:hypothetical protein N7486_004475 [Penicillium sp. IBT 16267x]